MVEALRPGHNVVVVVSSFRRASAKRNRDLDGSVTAAAATTKKGVVGGAGESGLITRFSPIKYPAGVAVVQDCF
jgi:hypothetical protein